MTKHLLTLHESLGRKENSMKKRVYRFAAVIGLSAIAVGILLYRNRPVDASKLETRYMSAIFAVDMNNPKEVVGNATHVFVGYIRQKEETYYIGHFPYTRYSVEVVDSIKGDLTVGNLVTVDKEGGIAEDKSCLILYREDILPEEGQYYVFLTRGGRNGDIYTASGMNTTVLLDMAETKELAAAVAEGSISATEDVQDAIADILSDSSVYKTYLDAYKNQIVYDPNRE